MQEVHQRVRAELRSRLLARGATADFGDQRVFEEVDTLLRQALLGEDRHRILLPELMGDEWSPELSLRLTSHRTGPVASLILFAKRRVLLPLTRWLFEYTLENFRRQDRLNVALMACIQALAADHARLQLRVAELEEARGRLQNASPDGTGSTHL